MTPKQQAALRRFILRKATIADVQAIEALCAVRRRAILRTAQVVELGSVAIKPGKAGAVLR